MALILLLIQLSSSLPLNPTGPIHEAYVLQCLNNTIIKQFRYVSETGVQPTNHVSTLLLSIITSPNLTSPAFEIQQNLIKTINLLQQFQLRIHTTNLPEHIFNLHQVRPNFYLFIVDSIQNFNLKLETLTQLSTYNPKALMLVYYTKSENFKKKANVILDSLWNISMVHSVVSGPTNLKTLVFYSLEFNYQPGDSCVANPYFKQWDLCDKGFFAQNRKYYNRKIKGKNLNNCTIQILAHPSEPYVINPTQGFEISLLKTLGKELNISFEVSMSPHESWGLKQNGSWTGTLGDIFKEPIIGVGNFYFTLDYMQDFEPSIPYYVSQLVWVVPIAQLVPKWRTLTIIFSLELWSVCAALILACAILFFLTAYLSTIEHGGFRTLSHSTLVALQVIITSATSRLPLSDLTRIVFVALAIFSIIISSVYTSGLINYLTNPKREHQIDSMEDILDNDLNIGGLEIYKDIFKASADPLAIRVAKRFEINDSVSYWWKRVADDRDTASIASHFSLMYLISQKNPLLTTNGKPKVHVTNRRISSYSTVFVVNEGFPFTNCINHKLKTFLPSGIIIPMYSGYTEDVKKLIRSTQDETFVEKLSVDNLQGAFAILLVGFVLGCVSLVFEWMVEILRQKFCKKNQ